MLTNNTQEPPRWPSALGQPTGVPGVVQPPASQIDLMKLMWRYRFLLVLGLAVGLGGGYYHYIQSPELYLSSAKVQIVEPVSNNLPVQGLEAGRSTRSLADEALVMRSEGILRRAVELGDLDETPVFQGRSPEAIASRLTNALALKIGPANPGQQTSVFQISYEAGDPLTSQRVVQSIIDAYADHLQSQYRNVGKETLELIQSARDDVLKRLETIEDDFDQFKQASALVIRDGRAASVHRDNADKFLAAKQELLVRKTRLNSSLRAASSAMQAGEPLESILMALSGGATDGKAGGSFDVALERQTTNQIKQLEQETRIPASEQMRQTRLLPLELRISEMMQQFGAGHPAVKQLQAEQELVLSNIQRLAVSEAEYTQKMQEIRDAELRNREGLEDPEALMRRNVELKILAIRQQLASVEQELEVITDSYEFETEAAKSESAAEMQVARFEREISRQQALYDRIVARLDELNIMSDAGSLRVFALESAAPGYQTAPKIARSLLLGGILGIMIAGSLAYLRELSDKSYRSAEQIAEHLRMPVIGHVPVVKSQSAIAKQIESALDPFLVSYFRPKSSSSESFKALRTAIYFSNRGGGHKVIQVTSPTPGDGKSTIAANLAITMAQSGKSVLLLDTDLRRPRVQKQFGMNHECGLAWLLEELPKSPSTEQVRELIGEVTRETEIDNLTVIGAGTCPDNPSELLSSSRFDVVLTALRGLFDVIIVDSPPMLAVTDPSTIAPRVDAVMLVVRVRKNVKPLAARAARMLETLEANVIGVVVNGVGSRAARGYGKTADADGYYNRGEAYQYGYGYSYGSNADGRYNEYYNDDGSLPLAKKKRVEPARLEVSPKSERAARSEMVG